MSTVVRAYQKFVPVVWLLLCWYVIPLAVSFFVSKGALRIFSARYLVAVLAPLLLLAALGIAVLRWRVLQIVCALGMIVLALHATPYYYRSAQVEDWNSASHWLIQKYQVGDGLVCYPDDCVISVEYYLHAYPGPAHFAADAPGAFSWQGFNQLNSVNAGSGSLEPAVNPTALAEYGAKHQRLFYIYGRVPNAEAVRRVQNAQQWLDDHYRLVDQLVTRTVIVRLYETGSPDRI